MKPLNEKQTLKLFKRGVIILALVISAILLLVNCSVPKLATESLLEHNPKDVKVIEVNHPYILVFNMPDSSYTTQFRPDVVNKGYLISERR